MNIKSSKFLVHWSSKIPLNYKRKAITGELQRAKQIAINFKLENNRIRQNYCGAGYPIKVINNVINRFNQDYDELIIPQWLFDERKEVL